ncbi:1-phosphofructokinase family hexose kinase [Clostridia bacterium OttesenSCG-928-F22]|nr:1-phosphofructokinase family hexose kinase [Clostridia bacterium OttesenSCG-928-F22]
MIYTLTLNPALDYNLVLNDLELGGINKAQEAVLQCGGKGINVSATLHCLGVESCALGFLAGFTGKEIERRALKYGLATDFLWLAHGESRINVKVKALEETDINANGPIVSAEEVQALYSRLEQLCAGDILILSGSLPRGLDVNIYAAIVQKVQAKGVRCIVDAAGEPLKAAIEQAPFLIKPNLEELGMLHGGRLSGAEDAYECAKKILQKGVRYVLVSMGEQGAMLCSLQHGAYVIPAATGKVRSTTGAGDALLGGFVARYSQMEDALMALQWGVAAGCASTFAGRWPEKSGIFEQLARLPGGYYIG